MHTIDALRFDKKVVARTQPATLLFRPAFRQKRNELFTNVSAAASNKTEWLTHSETASVLHASRFLDEMDPCIAPSPLPLARYPP